MDQIGINRMMDKYAEVLQYSNTVGGRTNNLVDWIVDVVNYKPAHAIGLRPGDPMEQVFGRFAHFVRLNEDTEGIGLLLLRYRNVNDGTKPGGRYVFGWETIDLTDAANSEVRKMIAEMFQNTIPDHYDSDLHIITPFENKEE